MPHSLSQHAERISHDLLPWADPYIASLVAQAEEMAVADLPTPSSLASQSHKDRRTHSGERAYHAA